MMGQAGSGQLQVVLPVVESIGLKLQNTHKHKNHGRYTHTRDIVMGVHDTHFDTHYASSCVSLDPKCTMQLRPYG